MMWENWVIDATMPTLKDAPGAFTFIPVEGELGSGKETYVVGMNYISTEPPDDGNLVGIIHEDGQEAVDAFCRQQAEHLGPLGFVFCDKEQDDE